MFPGDLLQFNLSDFNIVLGMNWLYTYGIRIDYKDLKVVVCNEKGQEVYWYGKRKEKPCSLISIMLTSKPLCQGCFRYWWYATNTQNKEDKQRISL